MRGDGDVEKDGRKLYDGSPPRAWGRRQTASARRPFPRFTPTCVGTAPSTIHTARGADGSPPRAWGRLLRPVACSYAMPVHPHVRGDGARLAHEVGTDPRFTPTCVGTAPDDPLGNDEPPGSPPRAWGRRGKLAAGIGNTRFTPTCVGTAGSRPTPLPPTPVHPHVRGDGSLRRAFSLVSCGSPPRAWGRPVDPGIDPDTLRFTPTCVGTAIWSCAPHRHYAVHPHVRGDGHGPVRLAHHVARFTPTCVGTAAPA